MRTQILVDENSACPAAASCEVLDMPVYVVCENEQIRISSSAYHVPKTKMYYPFNYFEEYYTHDLILFPFYM